MRIACLAMVLAAEAILAGSARGELPVIAPQSDSKGSATEAATAPDAKIAAETRPIVVGSPETAMWAVSCQPASATCATSCEKRPGLLTNLKNLICGTSSWDACPPYYQPPTMIKPVCTKPVAIVKSVEKAKPAKTKASCPPCETKSASRFACDGSACSRIKNWLCWKPCDEQLLPIRAEPYRAPVTAYFTACTEPPAGMPCAKGKKCAKGKCEAESCPQSIGPVVAAKTAPVMGLSKLKSNDKPSPTKIVPAGATLPASPTTVNPISRPFTSP